MNEIDRREKVKEKFKYLCVAFDGDHPQIVATERVLIPRSMKKQQDLVFVKWAGGCSMTQSPNDNNRGMHPVLKKIYGDSKFRYDPIADPHGGKWSILKEYLKRFLDPASFRTVWKAMCYAPATLQNACKASSIRSAYHNCGLTRTLGWNGGLLERGRRKGGDGAGAMDSKVVRLQINTAGIMAMNRVDRIVLDPIRTYACTRTARTGVRVTVPLSIERGVLTIKIHHENTNYE